ncbi:MAG: hypothetical protein PUP92_36050 [Rhizonema sp. PD38]|nr:hypothetical protein [Rhizonema sp. PD38]
MFDVFSELKSQGKILLVITHDLGMTLANCDFLLFLNKQLIGKNSVVRSQESECLSLQEFKLWIFCGHHYRSEARSFVPS